MDRIVEHPDGAAALCAVGPDSTCDGAAARCPTSERAARADATDSTTARHLALLWVLSLLAVLAAAALFAWQVHATLR